LRPQVIEYCKFHVEAAKPGSSDGPSVKEEDVKNFDTEFVKVDQGTLFELILVRDGTTGYFCRRQRPRE